MSTGVIIGIIVGVVILMIIIYVISIYNKINKTDLKCQQALSGIDVALTKRYDMLTKLLNAAREYAKFEYKTILETIELRKYAPLQQKMQTNNQLDQAQTQLFGLMENYPQLQASQNYNTLQTGIMDAEDHLQAARRAYNANVDSLNSYFVTFPSNMIADITGKKQREFFKADEQHKQDVEIGDFNFA